MLNNCITEKKKQHKHTSLNIFIKYYKQEIVINLIKIKHYQRLIRNSTFLKKIHNLQNSLNINTFKCNIN